MSGFILEKFNIRERLLGKVLWQIREYSINPEKASDFFDLIITQLKSCNPQNCEPETIYKNAMAIGDFWGMGADDFKRRVDERNLVTDPENWFFRAFVGGAKFSRNMKDTRTPEEKAADLEKLKKLAGFSLLKDEQIIEKKEMVSSIEALESGRDIRLKE